ncbi:MULTISPECIES: heavy metal transporter [unclassified Streptomyces]|uniref:heavy metal transporter n=1 Tax=unclassified Streptomyces TaxID=2593676 RepID=UPI00344533BA
MGARRRARRKVWPVVIGLGVVLALVSYLAVRFIRSVTPDECTARGSDGKTVTLDLDQASHAATIAAVAHARGLPERAVTIALATAIQESKLRNLSYGDRDSLGLFQQRPSQGWGTPAQISDPVHAVGRFFDALVKVPDYLNLPVTEAAQQVQHSGYPEAYAQHQAMAATLADVLTGRAGPALSCTVRAAQPTASAGQNGTADAVREDGDTVAAAVRREFGRVPAAAVATGGDGVNYAIATGQAATGWSLALWLVCHATTLHATTVTFDGRRWSSTESDQGWARATPGSGAEGTATLAVTLGSM